MSRLTDMIAQFTAAPDAQRDELAGALAHDSLTPVAASLRAADGAVLALADDDGAGGAELIVAAAPQGAEPAWFAEFSGERGEKDGATVLVAAPGADAMALVRRIFPNLTPRPLGLDASFGFGDRLGLATPGHVAALRREGADVAPIFAQQSIREMERTCRTPDDVMADATRGAFRAGWTGPVGADADHLKTFANVDDMAKAGFVFFTIDPSEHVDQKADDYSPGELDGKFAAMVEAGVPGASEFLGLYKGKSFDLGVSSVVLDETSVKRAAVKYGRALAHIKNMADRTAKAMDGKPFELEISVDETDQPTSVPEHLFIALELSRRGVAPVSLAPRFIGDFEKGVDYKGSVEAFRQSLVLHAAVAELYGPYKISLHSGSDKFGVYPLVGELTKGAYHVKTAGTSYLEALRAVCRVDPELFREIAAFSLRRFEADKVSYHISAVLDKTPAPEGLSAAGMEKAYLDEDNGRQILHVTFGSVLTTRGEHGGYLFRDDVYDLLRNNRETHEAVLAAHLAKHLRLLTGGRK